MVVRRPDNGYSVQVLERAFRILELLARRPARATEIGPKLGLHRSTVFRLLANLEQWGYVRRDEQRGTYALGTRLFELGARALSDELPLHRLRPILAQLAERSGHSAQLWSRSDGEALCLDQAEPSRDLWVAGRIGRRLPLNCGAVAKVLLAYAPPELRARYLAGPLPRLSEHSVVDPTELRAECALITERGYAVSDGEMHLSSKAVAAPVFHAQGDTRLAVCILAPSGELRADNLSQAIASVTDAAAQLSDILGGSARQRGEWLSAPPAVASGPA